LLIASAGCLGTALIWTWGVIVVSMVRNLGSPSFELDWNEYLIFGGIYVIPVLYVMGFVLFVTAIFCKRRRKQEGKTSSHDHSLTIPTGE